jgi:cobalt/nickel transport system permease protein
MHIPDNFLSTPVWAALDVIAAPAVALVSRRASKATDTSRLPLLGVMGAFVFAAQMINFPVGAGTSGHLVGGTLLACILGPEAAVLVVTSILLVQALVFQDGGVLALGANIFNMALCGVLAGYLPYSLLRGTRHVYRAAFIGGICSVMASGILALSELVISGIHMPRNLILLSLFVGLAAFVLGCAGLLVASTAPDGLEQLAAHLGIAWDPHPVLHAPFAAYQIQAFGSGWFSKVGAGFLGLLAIYTICLVGSRFLARARRSYSS